MIQDLTTRKPPLGGLAGTVCALILALIPGPGFTESVPAGPEPAAGSDFIRVTEEPWKLGEVRSYTLLFDRAPFGREAIRLLSLEGDRRDRRLVFGQTLTLDLRALGQEGFLTLRSTLEYERAKFAREYRVESERRRRSEYSTYPKTLPRGDRTTLSLLLGGPSPRMSWDGGGGVLERTLPPLEGAQLADPLSMVTWERLFLGDAWKVGETRTLDLFLPDAPRRYDYHLPPQGEGPPTPQRMRVSVSVERRETLDLFSVPFPAFRCKVSELGLTLWVTASGGILKVDDGRGLVASLEP
jgi:hypothetical protein